MTTDNSAPEAFTVEEINEIRYLLATVGHDMKSVQSLSAIRKALHFLDTLEERLALDAFFADYGRKILQGNSKKDS